MRKLLVLLFGMMLSSFAHAATVSIEFVGPGTSVPYHGVHAGYYIANVNGTPTAVMCDDFTNVIHAGDTWQANTFTYTDVLGGAGTKFSGITKYAQVGWLYSQTSAASPSVRAQIQGAVWNIMTPGSVAMDSLAQWYHDQATSGYYDNFNWSNIMVVLTPNPHNTGQEFLVPVPLPASVFLFGSGMFGLVGFARHKRHKMK